MSLRMSLVELLTTQSSVLLRGPVLLPPRARIFHMYHVLSCLDISLSPWVYWKTGNFGKYPEHLSRDFAIISPSHWIMWRI